MQNVATVNADGTGAVTIEGHPAGQVSTTSVAEARRALVGLVVDHAHRSGQVVELTARDPDTEHRLLIHPDGSVHLADAPPPAPTPPADQVPPADQAPPTAQTVSAAAAPTPQPVPPADTPQSTGQAVSTGWTNEPESAAPPRTVAATAPAPPTPAPLTTGREARERSFLAEARIGAPPPTGWRAVLARFGLTSGPSTEEVARWEDERAISQHWPGPRTIAVLNGKGGAGKTPSTALLSAMFARASGSGVLAWDNNVTRGTLGWRTETGPHEATVLDLIPRTEQLLTPGARAADLAGHVHHQTLDKYDVLRSNPLLLSTEQKLTPDQLDAVHAAVAKYYQLIFMDSGNDEGDALWLRMIDHADQIVVATTTRPDHAEAGRLLLNALADRDEHSARLAEQAVVLVAQADREEAGAASIADGFTAVARAVVTVPYDPALRQQWLRVDNLAAPTQRAYLRAAAAVAAGL